MGRSTPGLAAPADHGAREATQHLVATGVGVVLAGLTGITYTTTGWEQIAVGMAGVVATWLVVESPTGVRRYAKKIVPVVTGIAAAAVPLATSHGDLSVLVGIAGVVPVLHVLAGMANVARPNALAGVDPSLETEVPVATAPPAVDTSGPALPSGRELDTGILPAVTAISTPTDLTGATPARRA